MKPGLLLDTGALVAWERGDDDVASLLEVTRRAKRSVHVPTVVVAEAWRGGRRSARIAMLLNGSRIEPLVDPIARAAGEALGAVRGATTIDAIVAASARELGVPLVTSDAGDLEALADYFGDVELIAVGARRRATKHAL